MHNALIKMSQQRYLCGITDRKLKSIGQLTFRSYLFNSVYQNNYQV